MTDAQIVGDYAFQKIRIQLLLHSIINANNIHSWIILNSSVALPNRKHSKTDRRLQKSYTPMMYSIIRGYAS